MEFSSQDLAANFREQNAYLVPVMLKRLWEIQKRSAEEKRLALVPLAVTPTALRRRSAAPSTGETPGSGGAAKGGAAVSKRTPATPMLLDEDAQLMPGPAPEDAPPAGERQGPVGTKGKVLKHW